MKQTSSEKLCRIIRGRFIARNVDSPVVGATTDSRAAKSQEAFFAIKGENFDGHDYISAAADRGCSVAVVRPDFSLSPEVAGRFTGGVITVVDTIAALGELGAWNRSEVSANVIGVTGSNGKTTTKRMINHILSGRLRGVSSPKSFNNNIGVPITLLSSSPGDDYTICEIGTNAPGEISLLAKLASPDLAVITSIGATHLERLGSVEKVALEKASILAYTDPKGVAIVCSGSPELDRALRQYGINIIRFGQTDDADIRMTAYERLENGIRFQINNRVKVELPIHGRHNAMNAMAAIAVAQRLNISQEEAAASLANFVGVEMRLQVFRAGGLQVINDAYNANPASMLAAAEVLAEFCTRRRVIVAGDMRELGENTEQLHLQTGKQIAERKIDLVIGVGKLGSQIADGAASAGAAVAKFDDVPAAIEDVCDLLAKGDVVLVKGSRAMAMERIVKKIIEKFGAADDGMQLAANADGSKA